MLALESIAYTLIDVIRTSGKWNVLRTDLLCVQIIAQN